MRLKEIRESKKISQLKLANAIGVGRTTITNYETGVSSPDIDTIIRIAQYFNCSVDYLLGFSNEQMFQPIPVEVKEELTDKQKELLSLIKNMDNDDVNKIIGYAFSLSEKELTTEEKIEKLLKLKN